jgi:hypothetical protein
MFVCCECCVLSGRGLCDEQTSPTDVICVIDSVSTQNEQAEPMGDARSKTQHSKLGQNKITI